MATKQLAHILDLGNFSVQSFTEGDKNLNIIRSVRADLVNGTRPIEPRSAESPLVMYGKSRTHFGSTAYKYRSMVETVIDDKTDAELAKLVLVSTLPPKAGQNSYTVKLHWSLPDPMKEVDGAPVGTTLQNALNGTHKYIWNGQEMQVKVIATEPTYEGLAPVIVARSKGLLDKTGYSLCIDIGGGTVNVLVVDEGGNVIDNASFDKQGGVAVAADIAQSPIVKARAGDELSLARVMDAIADNTHLYCGRVSFADHMDDVVDRWYRNIMMQVQARFKPHFKDITGFLFIGGNARLIEPRIKSKEMMAVFPQPETANLSALRELRIK
jgi:hypothetical protein